VSIFEHERGDCIAAKTVAEAIVHGLIVEALYWGLYDYTGLWGDLFAVPSVIILTRSVIRRVHAFADTVPGRRMEGAEIDVSIMILLLFSLYTYGAIVGIPMMWAHAWAAQP